MAESTKIVLTGKATQALAFLQANPGAHFGSEIADGADLSQRGVHGVMNSLVKKGLVQKADSEREVTVMGKDGVEKTETRAYKVYSLTDAGNDFVIE